MDIPDHIFADILSNHDFTLGDGARFIEQYNEDMIEADPLVSEDTHGMREQTLTYFHVKDFRSLVHGHGLQRSMNPDEMTSVTRTMAQTMTMEEISMAKETMRTSLQTFHSTSRVAPSASRAPTDSHPPPPPLDPLPPCHALFLDAPSPIILDSLQRPSSSTENMPLDCLDGFGTTGYDHPLDLDVPSTSDPLLSPFDAINDD